VPGRRDDERPDWVPSIPFLLMHLLPLGALWTGVSAADVVLCAALYFGRMFFITAGYHRYFSHRSYKLGRGMQFWMAVGGTLAVQKGPLWWAANHRDHHRYSDTVDDVHSPRRGFWWSHVGWFLCRRFDATHLDRVRDLAAYPELRWLDRWHLVPPTLLGVAICLVGGASGLLVGFFLSTVLLYHGTFLVNSLAHVIGKPRYETGDDSKNSWVIALLTMGEGWHNNHHAYPSSTRQGFFWWEFDPTYYALVVLSWLGLARDLRQPPARMLAGAPSLCGQPTARAEGEVEPDAEATSP
jgi:stearoyl-CoA desaturase (delta-9 desaturase)